MSATNQRLRASDANRDQVVGLLKEQTTRDRLTMTEFTERMSRAYDAVTLDDLKELTADLPAEPEPAEPPTHRSGGGMPWLLPATVACCSAVIIAVQVAFHRDLSAGVPVTIVVLTACCLAHRRSC